MSQFIVPVEATISYSYVVEASDINSAISKIDEYLQIKTDSVDSDIEYIENRDGYSEADFDLENIYENTGEYDTDSLKRTNEDDIWIG